MKKNWKQSVALLMMSLIICIGIVAVPKAVFADTNDIYWGIDDNNKMWISNSALPENQKTKKQGEGIWPRGGNLQSSDPAMDSVVEIEFRNNVTVPYSFFLFYKFSSCKSIKNLDYLDTSKSDNMNFMFNDCTSLTSLDVSKFNTSKVRDMSHMFDGCESLETLNLGNIDTSNNESMISMFEDCKSLTSIDVSKLNTSNMVYMTNAFYNCEKLNNLDVSKFDTSNVKKMSRLFSGCKSLTSINVSNFSTSNVDDMNEMFYGCELLTSIDVSKFQTSKVKNMRGMFGGCKKLESIDISNFNTSSTTNMCEMFRGCELLQSINVSNFNTAIVIDMRGMFQSCKSLKTLNLKNFDTSNVKYIESMFRDCTSLQSLNVSSFNTSNVTDMKYVFLGCSSLKTLDLGNFDVSNSQYVTDTLCFDVGSAGKIEEITISKSLNGRLSKTGLRSWYKPYSYRIWFVKNPDEVSGPYEIDGYDRDQISGMEGLELSGDRITYVVGQRNTAPVITASNITVAFGTSLEVAIMGFKATDAEDGVLQLIVKDNGNYDSLNAGTYSVTLSATDSNGRETTKTIQINVKAQTDSPTTDPEENQSNSENVIDNKIKTGGEEPGGAVFRLLQAKSTKVTNNSVTLTWNKVPKAAKYVVYGNKCGAKNKYIKLTTTKKQKITYKKIHKANVKKGTYYKFVVVAFDKNNKAISTSKTVHVATKGGKVGNDKKVTTAAKKNKVSLKKGKTFKLKAKPIVQSRKLKVKRHRKMAYETSNSKVAIVTGGKIKAIGKGSCYIYAYTQNGVCAKVKVIVK